MNDFNFSKRTILVKCTFEVCLKNIETLFAARVVHALEKKALFFAESASNYKRKNAISAFYRNYIGFDKFLRKSTLVFIVV